MSLRRGAGGTHSRPVLRHAGWVVSGTLLVAVGAGGGLAFTKYPELKAYIPMYGSTEAVAFHALGRNTMCTLTQAMAGREAELAHDAVWRRMERAGRLVRTMEDGFQLWETPHGSFWNPPGMRATWLYYAVAEQEQNVYGSAAMAVRAGDIVLDCGANLGAFTLRALNAGAGLVVAIEPAPNTFEALRKTFAREITESRVILVDKGVWDREGTAKFSIFPESTLMNRVDDAAGSNSVTVSLTTIDTTIERLGLQRVDFIKMDVEGAEQRALAGAEKTLARWHPRLAIATEHSASIIENSRRIIDLLTAKGYKVDCARCGISKKYTIVPYVLHFY